MILVAGWSGASLSGAEREAMGAASELREALGLKIAFVGLGGGGEELGGEAGSYGAAKAIVLDAGDELPGPTLLGVLAEVAEELGAPVVLVPGDDRGRELVPSLAERLGGAAITNAVALESAEGAVLWTRPVFGGKALARVRARVEPAVVSVRPGSFAAAAPGGEPAEVEVRSSPPAGEEVRLVSRTPCGDAGPDLEGARVIVSGGRGVGGSEGFGELEELARALGGSVGASLAAVDEGWASPEQQIGLTGRVVKPELYFAIGISGASQHLAGMGGAGTIVAVNTDPNAPIFTAADLGVVIDHRELLPAVIEECRRRAG